MNQSLQCKLHLMTKIFSTVKTNLFKDNSTNAVSQLLRYGLNQDNGTVNMNLSFKSYKKIFPEFTKEDFSLFLSVPCDSIVSSVEASESENDRNIIFYLSPKPFIEDVLLNRKFSDPALKTKQETVVIDYSSPNVAKPFHLGHLRSTIIGHFLGNLLEHLGHKVKRINYLGDWGTQFGVLQMGLQAAYLSNAELKRDPLQQLYSAYVVGNRLVDEEEEAAQQARRIFNSLEMGGSERTMERWKMIRQATVDELAKTYERLGIKFDEYHWESNYNAKAFAPLLDMMEANGLIEDDDGKKAMDLNGKLVPLLKSDGSTLYLTRDVGAALDRWVKYQFDRLLYVVDNSQNQHFSNLKKVLEKVDYDWADRVEHVKFGRIQGMSTRKGKVVFLKDILDEAKYRMAERQLKSPTTKNSSDKVADILGVSALVVNDLKQRRLKDYSFSWDTALQADGDSGVKLQYTHCRLNSLELNCGVSVPDSCDPSVFTEPEALALLLEIARFDEAVERAYLNFEASEIVTYLFRLCNRTSQALKTLNVKNQPANMAEQRLLLFHRARQTLHSGMCLLGLQPLQEM